MIDLKKDDLMIVSLFTIEKQAGVRAYFAKWGENKKTVFCYEKGLDSTKTSTVIEWDNYELA